MLSLVFNSDRDERELQKAHDERAVALFPWERAVVGAGWMDPSGRVGLNRANGVRPRLFPVERNQKLDMIRDTANTAQFCARVSQEAAVIAVKALRDVGDDSWPAFLGRECDVQVDDEARCPHCGGFGGPGNAFAVPRIVRRLAKGLSPLAVGSLRLRGLIGPYDPDTLHNPLGTHDSLVQAAMLRPSNAVVPHSANASPASISPNGGAEPTVRSVSSGSTTGSTDPPTSQGRQKTGNSMEWTDGHDVFV
jgi:hypothetical protein